MLEFLKEVASISLSARFTQPLEEKYNLHKEHQPHNEEYFYCGGEEEPDADHFMIMLMLQFYSCPLQNMLKTCQDQTTKYQSHFKREYTTIGKSFMQLGAAMQQDGNTSEW